MATYQADAAVEAANPDRLTDGPPDETQALYGDDYSDLGDLLTKSPQQAAKIVSKKWRAQDELMRYRLVRWEVNRLRRQGAKNVFAILENGRPIRWVPPKFNGPDTSRSPNVIADADRAFVSFLLADPPAPLVDPSSGDDEDVEAAQVATRILIDAEGEAGLRRTQKVRMALDFACDHGSAFEHFFVEPQGGGKVPIRIKAGYDPVTGQRATHVGPNGDPGDSLANPTTGMPWPEWQRRYVAPDGTLTDDENRAATKWAPRLASEILTGRNTRLLPHTATDVWGADGILLAGFETWGRLRQKHRGEDGRSLLDGLSEETREKVRKYRPQHMLDILPTGYTKKDLDQTEDKDETLVFWMTLYHRATPEYAKGCHVVVLGDEWAIVQQPWTATVGGGGSADDPGREVDLLLPVTQYAQYAEGSDDPYRVGLTQILGGLGEGHASLYALVWDYAAKYANRKTFLPVESNVRPHHLKQPGMEILPIRNGAVPVEQTVPPLAKEIPDLIQAVEAAIQKAGGIPDTALGEESADVQSGRHAYAIIGQAHGRVSEVAQNVEAGYARGCRIELQLLSVHMEDEQVVSWKDGGEYRTAYWRGTDLSTTLDVRVNPATMTMLTPSAKEMLVRDYNTMGIFQPHEARELLRTNVGTRVGLEDNKHLLRVRGQIAQYLQGPPKTWMPAQPQVDPTTGQQLPAQPDPVLASLWYPVPADELPDVAPLRLYELGKAMASPKHLSFAPEWRAGLDGEFARMRMIVYPPQSMAAPPAQQTAPGQAPEGLNAAVTPLPQGMGAAPPGITTEIQADAMQPQLSQLAAVA
jgi:hypothetical protein